MRFEDEIRENWGFQDGLADAEAGRDPVWIAATHPDPIYVAGYFRGRKEFLKSTTEMPIW